MFFRLRISLSFDKQDIPERAREAALWLLDHAKTINPGQPNEEKGFIILEKCHHDLDPSKPCEVIVARYTP